jgi:hypothetical protein
MRVRWDIVVLIALLSALLWTRMEFATQTPTLSYDSYHLVRSVEHIFEHGTPLRIDPLSITGHVRVTNPIFEYFLAAAILVSPVFYKLLPNLFMVLLLIPLYLLALRISQSRIAALVTVLLAGTAPVSLGSYLVTPAAAPIAAFLLFMIILLLHDTKKYLLAIIALTLLLAFLSPLVFLLVVALLAITVLLRVEGFGIDRRLGELFFFTLVLALWFYVLVFKQALFTHGANIIWQNLPARVVEQMFRNVTFFDAITGIGVISFLLGTIGAYYALFEQRERSAYAVIGTMMAVVAALLLRIVSLELGLLLLGLLLAVMAGQGLLVSVQYLRRTKAPWLVYPFAILIIGLFFLSALLPAIVDARESIEDTPSASDISIFKRLSADLMPGEIVLAPISEAAAVQYYSNRTTYTDADFLLVSNGDMLTNDVDAVYTARFSTNIVSRSASMGFTHVLFTRQAAIAYGREELLVQGSCIVPQMIGDAILYRITCTEVA